VARFRTHSGIHSERPGGVSGSGVGSAMLTMEMVPQKLVDELGCQEIRRPVGIVRAQLNNIEAYNIFIFENGSYGLYLYSSGLNILERNTTISNNYFLNQSITAIHLYYQHSPKIIANKIFTNSSHTNYQGINANYCHINLNILKNKISIPNGGYGVYIYQSNGNINSQGITANNFVHIGGKNTSAHGIFNSYSSYQTFYNNSVNITNSSTNGRAYYLSSSNNVLSKNNIFSAHCSTKNIL